MQATRDNDAILLEVLSDRLLTDFPHEVWRRAFFDAAPAQARFAREEVTFLCTDPLEPEWSIRAATALARRHGGRLEHDGAWTTLAFPDPQQALEVALLLQRGSARRLRCALVTSECTVASYEIDGTLHSLSLGCEHVVSQGRAERVPPGTIHLCAQTYLRLGDRIDLHTRSALVATELQDDVVTSAAITLPPSRQAALSTFAGLGLTT